MSLSTHALTTLDYIKREFSGKDVLPAGAEHDPLFVDYINEISAAVEQYCGRHFERATYIGQRYARPKGQRFCLLQWPVVNVTSLTVDGVQVYEGPANDQYYIEPAPVEANLGMLFRKNGWGWVPPQGTEEDRDLSATYTAGYALPKDTGANLPPDLQGAVAQLVITRYKLRAHLGLTAESSPDGVAMSFSWWPAHLRAVLDHYKRRGV